MTQSKWAAGIVAAVIMVVIAITAVMLPAAPLKGAVKDAPTVSQAAPADTEAAPSAAHLHW